jgi:hypothetical protein
VLLRGVTTQNNIDCFTAMTASNLTEMKDKFVVLLKWRFLSAARFGSLLRESNYFIKFVKKQFRRAMLQPSSFHRLFPEAHQSYLYWFRDRKPVLLYYQISMHEEIKSRLNLGNACYHSVHSLLSSCLLSRNLKVKSHNSTSYFVWV